MKRRQTPISDAENGRKQQAILAFNETKPGVYLGAFGGVHIVKPCSAAAIFAGALCISSIIAHILSRCIEEI